MDPDAQAPAPPRPRPERLPKDQQRFALVLAGVAIVLVGLVLKLRAPALDLGGALEATEAGIRARNRTRALHAVEGACRHTDCVCLKEAAGAGLDVDLGKEVLALLEHDKTCTDAALPGMRAEALVRSGARDEGWKLAITVLSKAQRDPYAQCALALALYQQGNLAQAAAAAKEADGFGRGSGAEMVLGLVEYASGNFDAARAAFGSMLETEPDDAGAEYNLALVSQQQGRYGESRRFYLAVLRTNPKHKEARYNLAILAHSIGADAEAQHHLEKLRSIDANDPGVSKLEAALATPPAKPPTHVLKLGAPSPSPAP